MKPLHSAEPLRELFRILIANVLETFVFVSGVPDFAVCFVLAEPEYNTTTQMKEVRSTEPSAESAWNFAHFEALSIVARLLPPLCI